MAGCRWPTITSGGSTSPAATCRSAVPSISSRTTSSGSKAGLAGRIVVHTDSVQGFLEKHDQPVTRFVLLDHMDWLSGKRFPLLEAEWQAIVRRAAPGARLIWRSGGLRTDFVDRCTSPWTAAGGRRDPGLRPPAGPATSRAMPGAHLWELPHCRPCRLNGPPLVRRKTLYHLLLHPGGGRSCRAAGKVLRRSGRQYDAFRRRSLPGREDLCRPSRGRHVGRSGGGTGANFESIGRRGAAQRLPRRSFPFLLDRGRTHRARGWTNVRPCTPMPPVPASRRRSRRGHLLVRAHDDSRLVCRDRERPRDAEAGRCRRRRRLLRVAQAPAPGSTRHCWPTRTFWPAWFACDNVFLSADHLPFLRRHFEETSCTEGTTKLPYLPLVRVPCYTFIGRKRFAPA